MRGFLVAYNTAIKVSAIGLGQNLNQITNISLEDQTFNFSESYGSVCRGCTRSFKEQYSFKIYDPNQIKGFTINGFRDDNIELIINGTRIYKSCADGHEYSENSNSFYLELSNSLIHSILKNQNTLDVNLFDWGGASNFNVTLTVNY